MGRRGYPPKSRRKVLDLVEAGRRSLEVAKALGIGAQSISTWRLQDRIATAWLLAQPPLQRRQAPLREGGFQASRWMPRHCRTQGLKPPVSRELSTCIFGWIPPVSLEVCGVVALALVA
jgi:hypothetical protein